MTRGNAEPVVAGPLPLPSEILVAWRVAERRYTAATPGSDEAGQWHLEMRRLMDEYEWRVRGAVPRTVTGGRPPVAGQGGRW